MANSVETNDFEAIYGSLSDHDIYVTVPVADDISDCPEEVFGLLLEIGLDFKSRNELVRLLNHVDGSSRWTSKVFYDSAFSKPLLHPIAGTQQYTNSQSGLENAREIIKSLHQKASGEREMARRSLHISQEYLLACHAHFFANAGAATWHHLSTGCRADHLQNFKRALAETYSDEARDILKEAILTLERDMVLSEDLKNLNYGQETSGNEGFTQFAEQTMEDLWAMIVGGVTLEADPKEQKVLDNVLTILDMGVSRDVNLQILSLAMIVWPKSFFDPTLPGMRKFKDDHDNHLQNLRISNLDKNIAGGGTAQTRKDPQLAFSDDLLSAATGGQIIKLGDYSSHFTSPDSGLRYFNQARRTLDLVTADNLEHITSNVPHYVREIYQAIRMRPVDENEDQKKASEAVEKKLQDVNISDKHVEALANSIVKALIDLHTHGDRFFDKQIKLDLADRSLTAKERIEAILKALVDTKRVVIDLVQGYDNIVRFVAAPWSHYRRKNANAKGNQKKKEEIKEGSTGLPDSVQPSPQTGGRSATTTRMPRKFTSKSKRASTTAGASPPVQTMSRAHDDEQMVNEEDEQSYDDTEDADYEMED